jgi:hypothetical protein
MDKLLSVSAQPERVDFAEPARSTADQMRLLAEEKHIALNFDGAKPVHVEAAPDRIWYGRLPLQLNEE